MPWAPDYINLAELRNFATRSAEVVDDVELQIALTAASRAVDKHTGRQFGKVAAEARRYTARFHMLECRWVVDIDDVMDLTGLDVQVPAGQIIDVDFLPANAAEEARPWTRLVVLRESPVQPTGKPQEVTIILPWGWTAVPVEVQQATLLQGNRFFSRRTSPYGVAGSPDQGSELRLLSRLDPDVGVSLSHLIRRRTR